MLDLNGAFDNLEKTCQNYLKSMERINTGRLRAKAKRLSRMAESLA